MNLFKKFKKPDIITILRKWEKDGYVCASTSHEDFDRHFSGCTVVHEANNGTWAWMHMGDSFWIIYRGEPNK